MTTQRDKLAIEINKAINKIYGIDENKPAVQDFQLADALLAAGWEKPIGDSFQLQASLTTGEVVIVKVSGYSNLRQGCAALVKVADVQTLSQIIAGAENEDED